MANIVKNKQIEWMLFIAVILFFYPYLSLGFTTNDDAFNQVYHLWVDFKDSSFTQGRVQFILAHWLIIKISFLIKNIFFIKFITTLSVIFNIIYFSYFIEKITKQRYYSYIFIAVFITFLQDSWEHFLLTSSPLIYTVGFSFFLASLHLYVFNYSTKSKLILSSVFFVLAAQISEMFFLFFIFYPLFSYYYLNKTIFFKLKYHFIFLSIYILIYVSFRLFFSSMYEGNSVNGFSFLSFIKTLLIYSLSTIPPSLFLSPNTTGLIDVNEYLNYPFDFKLITNPFIKLIYAAEEILFNLDEINVIWIVKYLFFISIVSESLRRIKNIDKKTIKLLLIFSVILIFIPNVLHSLTGKYQDWALLYDAKGYVGTYFSYFGMVLFATFLGVFLKTLGWFNKATFWGKINLTFMILGLFFVSVFVSISNEAIFNQKKQSHYRWEIMDKLFKSEAFDIIKDGDNIYTLGLVDRIGIVDRYIMNKDRPDYWDRYTLMKTGKKVRFFENYSKKITGNNNYILKIIQHKTSSDIFAVLAKILPNSKLINDFYLIEVSNGTNILSYETLDSFKTFPFRLKNKKDYMFVKEKSVSVNSIWVNYPIRNRNENVIFPKPMQKGNIYTDRFEYEFSKGFYSKETRNMSIWYWSKKESQLVLNNNSKKKIEINLKFLLSTKQEKDFKMSIFLDEDNKKIVTAHTEDDKVVLSFTLEPGENKINFIAEKSTKPLPNVVSRELYFKVKNLIITEVR